MRLGMILIAAGVLLFLVTLPNSFWLARGNATTRTVANLLNGQMVSGGTTVVQQYDLKQINTLKLHTYSGNIEIKVSQTMSSNSEFEIESVGHLQIPKAVVEGNTLRLEATTQPCNACSLDYRIKLGKAVRLELQAANGIISVNGLTNSLRVSNQNGDIELKDLGKTTLFIRNQNGSISLENASLVAGSQNSIENQNGDLMLHNLGSSAGLTIQNDLQNGNYISEITNRPGNNPAKLELKNQNGDVVMTK